MKKLTLLFTFSLFTMFAFAQPYTWTNSAGSGNWTNPAIWTKPAGPAYDYPQTTDDIVIIEDAWPGINANIDDTVQSITINNTGTNKFSQLTITSGDTVVTTGDFVIKGTNPIGSNLLFNGHSGVLVVGDGPEDGMIIEGRLQTTGDTSKILIGGYYKHLSGTVEFAGSIVFLISTKGAIPSATDEHNFFISSNAEYKFGAGTVKLLITVLNGNLSTKEEVYLEDATVTTTPTTTGWTITLIGNDDGSDNSYAMKTDMGLGEVGINIGDATMTYENVTADKKVVFRELYLFSGHFDMQPGSLLEIEPTATFF